MKWIEKKKSPANRLPWFEVKKDTNTTAVEHLSERLSGLEQSAASVRTAIDRLDATDDKRSLPGLSFMPRLPRTNVSTEYPEFRDESVASQVTLLDSAAPTGNNFEYVWTAPADSAVSYSFRFDTQDPVSLSEFPDDTSQISYPDNKTDLLDELPDSYLDELLSPPREVSVHTANKYPAPELKEQDPAAEAAPSEQELISDTFPEENTGFVAAEAPREMRSAPAETPSKDLNRDERASVTPVVPVTRQYSIPFQVLHAQKKSGHAPDPRETSEVIARLEETLLTFGIDGKVVGIQRGPIITRYELKMPPGIKVARILALTDELAMALEALRVRIEAPIPGRSTVGIEIPNKSRSKVLLGDLISDPSYRENEAELPLPLGKDIAGNPVIEDLTRMPHILIAGATGSGKSVAVNSFITSLILHKTPEEVRFLLVDPKLVELSHYNDIPHLLHPVITEPQKSVLALNWAVEEMERRYEDMAEMRSRDIRTYNRRVEELNRNPLRSLNPHPRMPYIVVLIDELGDLMMVAGKEVENSIIRLSQKARAVGIHLILATQRPSVDVITALIKANCPARIALQVAQKTDSRTILDTNGAEQLLGQGDLLFRHPSRAMLTRVQSPYVTDEEVEDVVGRVRKMARPVYITLEESRTETSAADEEDEELFNKALDIIREEGKASASYLQRRLRIGYNRAARLIESFEARGYIGPQIGSKPREILL